MVSKKAVTASNFWPAPDSELPAPAGGSIETPGDLAKATNPYGAATPKERLFQSILQFEFHTDLDPLGKVLSPAAVQEARNMPLQDLIAMTIAAQALKGCTQSQEMVFRFAYPDKKNAMDVNLTAQTFLNTVVAKADEDDTTLDI